MCRLFDCKTKGKKNLFFGLLPYNQKVFSETLGEPGQVNVNGI